MKPVRGLIFLVIVVAMLFAFALSVNAIGFEAEVAYESIFVIYSGESLGSGFAIGKNCIVTNAHVIENVKDVSVVTYGDAEYHASVYDINHDEDIAVLIVENATFPYLSVSDLSTMKTGDDVYAIGAPKGMAYTLTKGGVSAKERIIGNQSYIQIDAPINEGNSGGPLLNDAGEVLGMNTLKMSDSEGLGLAIPMTRICNYLKSIGIELDVKGNVSEKIDMFDGTVNYPSEVDDKEDKKNYEDGEKQPFITYILFVILGVSLITNIVLAIMLIYQKKKNIMVQYDPRERVDFDIDIWE